MRLWSFHPRYLDARGLVALWREALLAQAVLSRPSAGYARHPQLQRFRAAPDPLAAIATYLSAIAAEADRRAYRFAKHKIGEPRTATQFPVARGQLLYEWAHLQNKLALRDPGQQQHIARIALPEPHPLFTLCEGPVEAWERVITRK